jgi:hypothetical protein
VCVLAKFSSTPTPLLLYFLSREIWPGRRLDARGGAVAVQKGVALTRRAPLVGHRGLFGSKSLFSVLSLFQHGVDLGDRRADAAEQADHAAVEFTAQFEDNFAPQLVEMVEQLVRIAVPKLAGGICEVRPAQTASAVTSR